MWKPFENRQSQYKFFASNPTSMLIGFEKPCVGFLVRPERSKKKQLKRKFENESIYIYITTNNILHTNEFSALGSGIPFCVFYIILTVLGNPVRVKSNLGIYKLSLEILLSLVLLEHVEKLFSLYCTK